MLRCRYETPDWCCAYQVSPLLCYFSLALTCGWSSVLYALFFQLKLNSFSMHCPDTAACRPSGATGMVYFREATTVEDMQGPLPGLTAG